MIIACCFRYLVFEILSGKRMVEMYDVFILYGEILVCDVEFVCLSNYIYNVV